MSDSPEENVPSSGEVQKLIKQSLRTSKQSLESILSNVENITYEDVSMAEWNRRFAIRIPDPPSPEELYKLFTRIHLLTIEANKHHDKLSLIKSVISREMDAYRAKKFPILKKTLVKGPSVEMIHHQIDDELLEQHNQLLFIEFFLGYWKRKLAYLSETRETIKSILYGLTTEMKTLKFSST